MCSRSLRSADLRARSRACPFALEQLFLLTPGRNIWHITAMGVRHLSERIIERLGELPPQLAASARFIVDHPDAMVMSSMRQIATRVGVAPTTLLRLARMLGYADWSRF